MLNMNLPTVALGFVGCFVYVCSMSALGRWLSVCSDNASPVYIAPPMSSSIGA